MKVSRKDFEMVRKVDEYHRGHGHMLGIGAKVDLKIRNGDYFILQTIRSPMLWGIESDSDEDYFDEIYQEECQTLEQMLTEMGMTIVG